MDLKEELGVVVEAGKAKLEVSLEAWVQGGGLDKVVDMIASKLCALIPSQIDDALMAAALPELKEKAKQEALQLVEQISDQV